MEDIIPYLSHFATKPPAYFTKLLLQRQIFSHRKRSLDLKKKWNYNISIPTANHPDFLNWRVFTMSNDVRPESTERITTPALAQKFIDEQIAQVRAQVGDKKVLLALSGGVDSSVVAALLIKAIGKQLVCVHVNHGLLRKGEPEQVVRVFRDEMDANLIYVDAVDRFLV